MIGRTSWPNRRDRRSSITGWAISGPSRTCCARSAPTAIRTADPEAIRAGRQAHPGRHRRVRRSARSSRRARAWSTCSTSWSSSVNVPILGVCLGMQLMASVERGGPADRPRLARRRGPALLVSSRTSRVASARTWAGRSCTPTRPSPLFPDTTDELRFYFSHAYHVVCARSRRCRRDRDVRLRVRRGRPARQHPRHAVPSREEPRLWG